MLSYPVVDRDRQRLAQDLDAAQLIRGDIASKQPLRRHLNWLPRLGRRTLVSN
ncbi:MAG TPA: hypothetical protein PKD84_08530 [Propionicimonas sp.]|nr:hypothetical protein [Propionicimonas sp.]